MTVDGFSISSSENFWLQTWKMRYFILCYAKQGSNFNLYIENVIEKDVFHSFVSGKGYTFIDQRILYQWEVFQWDLIQQ